MSMWTAVTVQTEEGAELPSLARLIALWNANVDGEHRIVRSLAKQLTTTLPGLVLTLEEEWTGEEPGVTRERWQDGRVTGIRTSDGDLVPVDALGRTPENALASILAAVGALGDTLMMVHPGEDFWEGFNYVEGDRLAEVFEAAGLPERAAMVRERCREADPEAWEEAETTA